MFSCPSNGPTFIPITNDILTQLRHIWCMSTHDDVIKSKTFPRYWPCVRGIHRSPVNSAHKGQWRGALMFSLIFAWINGWVNNREADDLRRHRAPYDVTVMSFLPLNDAVSHDGRWCHGIKTLSVLPVTDGFSSQRASNMNLNVYFMLAWITCVQTIEQLVNWDAMTLRNLTLP